MIHSKIFEIRDVTTFIPCIATCLSVYRMESRLSETDAEEYLVRRSGFAPISGEVFLAKMTSFEGRYDPTGWDNITMKTAHEYIRANWGMLNSGDVIDAEFLRGETKEPKISERESGSLWAGVYGH